MTASKSVMGRAWSKPRMIALGNGSTDPYPHLAVNAAGDAIATWSGNPVEAAVRVGQHGRWHHAVKLGYGGVSEVAIDQDGSGVVVWQQPDQHSILIDATAYSSG
jgi:hypothetical protein